MRTPYLCWHGDASDRMDEQIVEANDAREAAMRFAIEHDDGEDYDYVFVLDEDAICEYRCRYERSVSCSAKLSKTHPLTGDDE